jgi:ankyrin repeat protein
MSDALPRSSDLAKRLLYEGFRPEEQGEADGDLSKGEALRWAARGGVLQLTQLLIDKGTDIDAQGDGRDGTALHYAIEAEHYDVMNLLLAAGASASAQSETGHSALHAVATSTEDSAEAATAIRVLVEKGADVTKKGWTPVHLAASHGSEEILKTLLAHGPDLTVRTNKGLLPSQLARKLTKDLLDQTAIANGQPVKEPNTELSARLVAAAGHGNLPRVMRLLENGVDIDSPNLDGRRAASLAAENGHSKILELLLQRGADPNLEDPTGESALWWASRYGPQRVGQAPYIL